ncbi:MAG: hypothetical protein K6E50_08915 [Lachnospiraceae bacterium]|nr:hypothetical protein [Lachnospiraceae bacterium]
MEKDLQSEYQAMIRAELPDLWSRIESKIDAQEAQGISRASDSNTEVKAETIREFRPEVKKKKTVRWQYIALPAAAVLLAAIILPMMSSVREMAGSTSMAPTADTAFGDNSAPAAASNMEMMAEPATMEEAPVEYACEEESSETDDSYKAKTNGNSAMYNAGDTRDLDVESIMGELNLVARDRADEEEASEEAESASGTAAEEENVVLYLEPTEDLTVGMLVAMGMRHKLTVLSCEEEENGLWKIELDPSYEADGIRGFLKELVGMDVKVVTP